MTFLDTGILVGMVLEQHPDHTACISVLDDAAQPFTNAHALAETFATLTGFYKVPVASATELTLALREVIPAESLTMDDYETALQEAKRRGVMGGGIYDSLHATFARRKQCRQIATLNPSHFRHVAPEVTILTP